LILTGQPALRKRPADMIPEPLIQLGAIAWPTMVICIKNQRPVERRKVNIDGSLSSQFLTGLLMALPIIPTDSEITVANLKSKPYIDLTLEILGKFGIRIEHQDYRRFFVPGGQKYQPVDMNVEAISAARLFCWLPEPYADASPLRD
jgi:3-phosphoshikimate 1-carboxyvinyltransferase